MDERLRRLERRGAGGDPAAEGRRLRERVRLGRLDADRLRLAAHLGDPAARHAVGEPPDEALGEAPGRAALRRAQRAWCDALRSGGQLLAVRITVAAAASVERFFSPDRPPDDPARWALGAAQAWLARERVADTPLPLEGFVRRIPGLGEEWLTGRHDDTSACMALGDLATEAAGPPVGGASSEAVADRGAAEAAAAAAYSVASLVPESALDWVRHAMGRASVSWGTAQPAEASLRAPFHAAVHAAVRRAVVPWLLAAE